MTVIAWDGYSIAVDRQATYTDCRVPVQKWRRLESGSVLLWSGGAGEGGLLADLYARGELESKWPEFQKTDDWTRLVVASSEKIVLYEKVPFAQVVYGPFEAWGSGFKYAMGAMWCGADAKRAVECASEFDTHCGLGVDVFELRDRPI